MGDAITASIVRTTTSPTAPRRIPVKFRKSARARKYPPSPLLSGARTQARLSQDSWTDLRLISHQVSFPAGTAVFVEGEPCRGIYILRQGRAKLSIGSSEGRTLIVRIAGSGEILSLNPCLTGGVHDTTLETTQSTDLAFIRRSDFLNFLNEHRDATYLVNEQLMRDYRGAYELVRSIGLAQTITQKLARFLLQWADEDSARDGACHLTTYFTHDEMGQMVGATRETVTRTLSLLRRENVIDISDSRLLIRDIVALQHMAG